MIHDDQNWSNNVYNLVTKRAVCEAGATMEWVDGNIGSKVTMKYPAVWLMGEHAKGETLSIAFAGEGQHQDTGSKMVHAAPYTSSSIISKSVARNGGRASYRGLVKVEPEAHHSASSVKCDALLVDTISRSDTYPYVDVQNDDVSMAHEATVSKVSDDQLFYLMQRGMEEDEAMAMIVRGFVEPIARELPMEYALELNRLIEPDGRCCRVSVTTTEEKKHMDAHGAANVASALERIESHLHPTPSWDLADHPVPSGREEVWRFTPIRRIRPLLNAQASDSDLEWEFDLPEGVTIGEIGASLARELAVEAPVDRVGALAVENAARITRIDVPANVELNAGDHHRQRTGGDVAGRFVVTIGNHTGDDRRPVHGSAATRRRWTSSSATAPT